MSGDHLEARGGRRWLALLAAAATCLALGGAGQPAPEWIPFETIDESALPIVSARVNGSEGFRLVVDPAVPETMLDMTMVAGLGLELRSRGETETIDYFGGREDVPVAYVDRIDLGNVTIAGVRVLLVEGDDVTTVGGIRSYGRLGREALSRLRVTVHYPRRLLLLEPSPPEAVPEGGVGFDPESRFVVVPVRIDDGIEGRFVLDPGAAGNLLDEGWARKRGLARRGEERIVVERLAVGGFVAEGLRFLLGDIGRLPYTGRPVGVLGARTLLGTAVTYDFPRRLVWIRAVDGGRT